MSRRLFVGNLPWSVTSEELGTMFSEFGPVQFAEVKYKDPEKRQSRGIGFVQLETDEQAEAAITALNGTEIAGRVIAVNHALPRAPRTDAPRQYGNGQNSGGYRNNDRGDRRPRQDYRPEPQLRVEEGGKAEESEDLDESVAA